MAKRIAGGQAIAINKRLLAKLEKLGASGITSRWAAMALMMSEDTFARRRLDHAGFAAAWARGRARFSEMVAAAAPKVHKGLIINATTKTESAPGGNVAAQLGFIEKVLRKPDAEEVQGQVSLEELGVGPQDSGPIEIQEVRVRRIKRTGRIEDDIFG